MCVVSDRVAIRSVPTPLNSPLSLLDLKEHSPIVFTFILCDVESRFIC